MQTQQELKMEETKPRLRNAHDSNVQSTPQILSSSNDFINEMSPAHAFSDTDEVFATFRTIDPATLEKHQHSALTSTPLNVVELSLNKSHLMTPPVPRSFRNLGNRHGPTVDSGSSPLEQQLPRDVKIKWLLETSQQHKRFVPSFEPVKNSNHSRDSDNSAASIDFPSSEKVMSPKSKDNDLELLELVRNPTALDDEWKRIDEDGDNATDLSQILAWFSTRFPKHYNDGVSVCKSFNLVASSIGGDTTHLIPRRVFKRLLMAIICINRSSNCFSSAAPGSSG
jgi:hypothetical protein